MTRISSFKVAAGMFGTAALAKLSAFAVALMMLGLASSAQAGGIGRPCTKAPQNSWLTIEALQAKVEALGFKVRKAKLKNACAEIYATDKNGERLELFLDPTNGYVVERL
jgi:hypothetical protein